MTTPRSTPVPPPARRRRLARAGAALLAAVGAALSVSCFHIHADNPAYPATRSEIDAALERMGREPTGLARPVLVLSGWRSPRGTATLLAHRIEALTGAPEDRVVAMSYPWTGDIGPLGDRVVAFVDEHWPSDDPDRTTEIDVVAISMGGLVARWAASDRGDGSRRLRINTLYTLASPHRGSVLADRVRIDEAGRQMRGGSAFLAALDRSLEGREYDLVPYAVLRDRWVGATRAAPPGMDPIWVPGRVTLSHHLVSLDERVLADLALRLRGEEPLGRPSAPPWD